MTVILTSFSNCNRMVRRIGEARVRPLAQGLVCKQEFALGLVGRRRLHRTSLEALGKVNRVLSAKKIYGKYSPGAL